MTSPFGEPVAGGRVTFTVPSTGPSAILVSSTATLDANGRGSVTATANRFGGSYTVTADMRGAESVAWNLTNAGDISPVAEIPPPIVNLRRSGIHSQPIRIVLTFSVRLDPARASDRGNYSLVRIGPKGRTGRHPQPLHVISAVYDPAGRTVTIRPRHRLALHNFYRLTVHGTGPTGVASVDGTPIDGTSTGHPGSDYVAVIHGFAPSTNGEDLVGPTVTGTAKGIVMP